MPRPKQPEKFRYTKRRAGKLYVCYPVPGLKNPVWRICREETQEAVNEIIALIKDEFARYAENATVSRTDTLDKYFAAYLAAVRSSIAARTFADYSELYARYAKKPLGAFPTDAITPLDLQKLYNALAARLDAAVVRKLHQLLKAAFAQAVKWKLLKENPADGLIVPGGNEKESPAMTREEARRFVEACRQRADCLVLEFALETGLRPEEYLALDWSAIDLENRRVHVRRAVSFNRAGGGWIFTKTKSRHSRRTVSFSEAMRARLIAHQQSINDRCAALDKRAREMQKEVRAKFVPKTANNRGANAAKRARTLKNSLAKLDNFRTLNLVFPSANGTPLAPGNLGRRTFKDALERARLDTRKFYLYSLRHTNATLLAQRLKPRELQQWMGHSAISTTFRYYVHVTDSHHDEASAILSDLLYD